MQIVIKCIYSVTVTQYSAGVRSPLGSSWGWGSCLQACSSSKFLKDGDLILYKEVAALLMSCTLQDLFLSFILSVINPHSCLSLQLRP